MKITGSSIDQVLAGINDGKFKVDDDKKAIVSCQNGRSVETVSVNKKGLVNVYYTTNKKSANALYHACKTSKSSKSSKSSKTSKSIKNRKVDRLPDNIGSSKNNSIKTNSGNTIKSKSRIAKIYKLIRAIKELTLRIQAKGVASTGKDQSKVVQDLEGIKLHAEDALRNTSPPLTTKNIVDVTKKTETVFKETNTKVIGLIKRTEEAEKIVVNAGNGGAYKYPEANPGGIKLQSRLNYWAKRLDDVQTEISKRAGDKLTEDNPNISNLSDPNRPIKLYEQISELYDNEWTNLLEDLEYDKNDKKGEKKMVTILYKSLLIAYDVCKEHKKSTSDEKETIILKEIQKRFGAVKSGKTLNDYVKQSTHICTHMLKNKNPLVFGEPPRSGTVINKKEYKEYNSAGNKVDYPAWPPVYLYKGGPLISKGVVEPLPPRPPRKKNIVDVTKKTETAFQETNKKVIELIKKTEAAEKRIVCLIDAYQYSEPNPGNASLDKRIKYWGKRYNDTLNTLSKISGEKLRKNNPGIVDLSDINRPTKLADRMSEIYDNQWTDACDEIDPNVVNEKLTVTILHEIIMNIYEVCKNNQNSTNDEKEAMVLKEVKDKYNSVKFGKVTNIYIKDCTDVCTHMLLQEVPVVLGNPPQKGSDIDKNVYRNFTASGSKADYPVWPSIFLYEGGPMLLKGVVQPIKLG